MAKASSSTGSMPTGTIFTFIEGSIEILGSRSSKLIRGSCDPVRSPDPEIGVEICERAKSSNRTTTFVSVMPWTKAELEEWRELFQLAEKFRNGSYWDHIAGEDIFGVKDPKTGEIGYCTIMGEMGEHYALAVYRDFAKFMEIMDRDEDEIPDPFEILMLQDCLMASFEDRRYLIKADQELLKELNLKYRGKDSWIKFRDFKPDYVPEIPDKDGRDFLKVCLEQAIQMGERAREDNVIFDKGDSILTRVQGTSKGKTVWKDRYMEPQYKMPSLVIEVPVRDYSEKTLDRNKTFEISSFTARTPVGDGEGRPYFPKALIVAMSRTGYVLKMELLPPKDYPHGILPVLDHFFQTSQWLPETILTDKPEIRFLLEMYFKRSKVTVQMKHTLMAIRELKESFDNEFPGFDRRRK